MMDANTARDEPLMPVGVGVNCDVGASADAGFEGDSNPQIRATASDPLLPLFFMSADTNPYTNLATEEALLDTVAPNEWILYLWQNRNTIVVGRNQNPWKECRVAAFEEDGGHLARRPSGGGAVFHDSGNLNFTFIAQEGVYDVARNLEVICEAVRSFNLNAQISGRNDIEIDGAKFSGNAFYRKGSRCCHHGTLMVDVDTSLLARYLQPDPRKLMAKGVDSVRSRVVNLHELNRDITVETLSHALVRAFSQEGGAHVQMLSLLRADANELPLHLPGSIEDTPPPFPLGIDAEESHALVPRIDSTTHHRYRGRFASWEWRFGKAVAFTNRFDNRFAWGDIDILLSVRCGIVEEVHIYSDALDADFIAAIASALTGAHYELSALGNRLKHNVQCETASQHTMIDDAIHCLKLGFA